MIAPAPVLRTATGYVLDGKFVEGMQLHCRYWPGPIDCILREGATDIPFGATEITGDTGFGLTVLPRDAEIEARHLAGYDMIYCSADDARNFGIADRMTRTAGSKLTLVLEYTLKTRLQAAWLDRHRSVLRRLYSMAWLMRQEVRLRRFVRAADGLQANGYPAHELYGRMNRNPLLYLDNRMEPALFATDSEMAARKDHLLSAGPLRLVYSGRLENMKGAQDLVPIARALRDAGTRFRLDIFGTGSLSGQIARDIAAGGLEETVTLHDPLDFETELVPYMRRHADIYLCCHRQSDPSCTYVENMGCGLTVAGYDNDMWAALCAESGAGWTSPLGNPARIAQTISLIDRDRPEIHRRAEKALAFARQHNFPDEFRKRMTHMIDMLGEQNARHNA